MKRSAAEIVREYGPFEGVDHVHGVTHDGQQVWFAAGDKLIAFDPASGKTQRSIDVAGQSVARHKSFRRGAAALGVTPSAISQAVRSLEARIGAPLFTRTTRSVGLTEA